MGRAKRTVLLVDDAELFRRSLCRLLEHDGHRVICAGDGSDALAKLDAEPAVDVVLLDLVMPVMDGFAFLEALRAGRRKDTPVIVLTADERRGSAKRAEALGARRCLHKGSTLFDQLSRCLREVDDAPPPPLQSPEPPDKRQGPLGSRPNRGHRPGVPRK